MLQLEQVSKVYRSGERDLTVLKDVSLSISDGESVAIVGPSGSGKTTLLGLCAGLDSPTTGIVRLSGKEISTLNEEERAQFRNQHVGFIFQNFQLIPTMTAMENVCIPLELQGIRKATSRALAFLDRVGLADRANHYPVQLSGGEQQRVAIARALIKEPAILFADEPTGNLDSETGAQIEDILFHSHRDLKNTLIVVTHDTSLAAKADHVIRLKSGRVIEAAIA